jgi:hypothetical protein
MFIFGALLGLGTESFLTKVVWGHPEHGHPFGAVIGGFGVWELFWTVFTYHAVMSAAVPFALCSYYFGLPTPAGFQPKPLKRVLIAIPIVTGALAALTGQPPVLVVGAFVLNVGLLTIVIAAFRRWPANPTFRIGRVGWALVLLVLVGYAGVSLPYRYIPAPLTLTVTAVLLILLVVAFVRSARLDWERPRSAPTEPAFTWGGYFRYLAYFFVALGVAYALVAAIGVWGYIAAYIATVLAAIAGTLFLGWSVATALIARPLHASLTSKEV